MPLEAPSIVDTLGRYDVKSSPNPTKILLGALWAAELGRSFTIPDMARAMELPYYHARNIIGRLFEIGVIERTERGRYRRKEQTP